MSLLLWFIVDVVKLLSSNVLTAIEPSNNECSPNRDRYSPWPCPECSEFLQGVHAFFIRRSSDSSSGGINRGLVFAGSVIEICLSIVAAK
jgi:hypothetical protein